jgi:hypothetical protein
MRRSLQRRLDALAKKIYSAERPPHLLWREPTENRRPDPSAHPRHDCERGGGRER